MSEENSTSREYNEKRHRLLLEATALVIWHTDPKGMFVDEQPGWARVTGQSFEQYRGMGWLGAVHPDDRKDVAERWSNAVSAGTIFQAQARVRCGATDYCHILMRAVPVRGEDVSVREWMGSLTDISDTETALRQSETKLRMLNETLEQRVHERTAEAETRTRQLRALALDLADTESRERKRLAQVLHDHFQQLISAAKLKVGMVRRGINDAKAIEILTQTESLLEEAIVGSRTLATELSPPVLNDAGLIAALEWLTRKMETDYGLRVKLACEAASEPASEQLRTLMFECARELLFNVVKHSETKEASITMSMSPDGLLKLAVADQGKGFDAHKINPDLRTEDASFGLFSIRERLGFVGGLLNIKTEAGVGTRIEMSVPVGIAKAPAAAVAESRVKPAVKVGADAAGSERRKRVLVADDHKLFRHGLINLLSQEPDLTVVGEAADGQEAVELARQLRPDILIVDVSMPKLNGMNVALQVSRELPQTRIVGLSMHEHQDMAKAMIAAGASAYLTKGGSSEVLLDVLRSLPVSQAAK